MFYLFSPAQKDKAYYTNEGNLQLYRSLQILNNRFNDAYSPVLTSILPFALFMTEVVFGVVAIKLYHVLPSVVYPLFPIVKTSILLMEYAALKIAARCHQESSLVGSYWKSTTCTNPVRQKYVRAFGKSSQAIKIVIGTFGFVSRDSVYMYLQFVMTSTISVMLAMEVD